MKSLYPIKDTWMPDPNSGNLSNLWQWSPCLGQVPCPIKTMKCLIKCWVRSLDRQITPFRVGTCGERRDQCPSVDIANTPSGVRSKFESPEAPTPVALRSESDRVCTAIKTALSEQREALKAAFATHTPVWILTRWTLAIIPPNIKWLS